jgi:hypothetical protein
MRDAPQNTAKKPFLKKVMIKYKDIDYFANKR